MYVLRMLVYTRNYGHGLCARMNVEPRQLRRTASFAPRSRSFVQTEPPRPKSVSFARVMASSTSEYLNFPSYEKKCQANANNCFQDSEWLACLSKHASRKPYFSTGITGPNCSSSTTRTPSCTRTITKAQIKKAMASRFGINNYASPAHPLAQSARRSTCTAQSFVVKFHTFALIVH